MYRLHAAVAYVEVSSRPLLRRAEKNLERLKTLLHQKYSCAGLGAWASVRKPVDPLPELRAARRSRVSSRGEPLWNCCEVALKVAFGLCQAVSAKLLDHGFGKNERDHRFSNDTGCRNS